MSMRRFLLLLSAAATLICPGCFKDVSDSTNYVLKPLVQNLSADPNNPLEGVRAYAFVADTALYTVASYEDALNGVVTSRTNSSDRLDPVATSEPCEREGTTGWIQMPLSGSSKKMIVAVDPTNRLYAYTQQEMSDNLPNLYVTLIFKLWKEGFTYKDGNWIFRNDYYTPPKAVTCYISPSVQSEEGGEPGTIEKLDAYAYAVDTTAWYIASYDDAVVGKITSKSDDSFTRTNPNFQAYKDSETGLYSMSVTSETLMVVVVDRVDRLYAYSQQTVDLDGSSPTYSVLFRPWRNVWIDVDNGWRIVNESLAPENRSATAPAAATQSPLRR